MRQYDVALIAANICLHAAIVAFLYWRRPMPLRQVLAVYFLSSWISLTFNHVGLMLGLWDFPSPSIGVHGTALLYDLFSLPVKVLMLVRLLQPSSYVNAAIVVAVAALNTAWEWSALHYSQLVVYYHWSLGWTFLLSLAVFSLMVYVYRQWLR